MRLLIGRHTRWSATGSAVYGFVSSFCSSYSFVFFLAEWVHFQFLGLCHSNATCSVLACRWQWHNNNISSGKRCGNKAKPLILSFYCIPGVFCLGARWITIHSEPLAKTTRENVKVSNNLFQSASRTATVVLVSLPPAFNQCFLLLFKNKSLYGSASAFLLFICKSDASDSGVQIQLFWEKRCKTLKKTTLDAKAGGFLTSEGKHCIVIAGFCFLPCPLLPAFF